MKNSRDLLLGGLFIYQSSIVSQILDLIHWIVSILGFDHMTGEFREYQQSFDNIKIISSDDNNKISESFIKFDTLIFCNPAP